MARKQHSKSRSRTRYVRPRRGHRRSRAPPLAQTAAGLFAAAQMMSQYAKGGTATAITSGNLKGLPDAFVADSKVALAPANIIAAATPFAVVVLLKKGAGVLGVPTPRVGKRRLF